MKDEIKEILDKNKDIDYVLERDLSPNSYCYIHNYIVELLDYITNLQQQLHQASLDIQELTERDIECPSWCDKLTNLQEEIKEANDSITWWTNRFKAVERDNRELKEELEEEKRIEEADLKTIQQLEEENETRQQDINNLTYQLAKMKEENERLKENNQAMQEEMARVWEENERLKDIVVEKDNQLKDMILQKTDYTAVNILEMKLKDYKQENERLFKEKLDIQKNFTNKIYKAIEYIKTQQVIFANYDIVIEEQLDILLNMLQK